MKSLIMQGAEPFLFKGDDTGFLLIHGFTGTPKEMRLLGDFLATKGHTVLGIRLAGHATDIKTMQRSTWQDWVTSVEDGFTMLNSCCSKVVSVGLSMGGALSIIAAAYYPLHAAVAISAPYKLYDWRLPLLRPLSLVKPYLSKGESDLQDAESAAHHADYPVYPTKSIIELNKLLEEMRSHLSDITIPVLLIHSKADQGVAFKNLDKLYNHIPAKQKEKLVLEKSGHVVTEDIERDVAFDAIYKFVMNLK